MTTCTSSKINVYLYTASIAPIAQQIIGTARMVWGLVKFFFHATQAIHACCLNLKDKKIVSWDLMMNDLALGMAGAACVIPLIGSIFAYYLREHAIEEIAIKKTYIHFKSHLERMKDWRVFFEENTLEIHLKKTNCNEKIIAIENQPIQRYLTYFSKIEIPEHISEESNQFQINCIDYKLNKEVSSFRLHANRILNKPYSLGNTSLRNALKKRKDYEGEELEHSFNELYYHLEWIRLLRERYPKSEDAVIAIFNLIKK